jgi:hypothetical protein
MGPASRQTMKYGKRHDGHIPNASPIGKGLETWSYTGPVLGGTDLLWTLGPKIVLLFLHEAIAVGY